MIDGLSAGASVEGLRITWYDDGRDDPVGITLNGVGVEMEIPDVLRFKGTISYDSDNKRFDGNIKLDLISLNMQVDGQLVIGYDKDLGYAYFAIYLNAELPAGIPLWTTGLGLYGMAGLFALSMEPNKQSNEPWYGIKQGEGWYKRPHEGVVDIEEKWKKKPGSLGFGAGVTIGTLSDNGFTVSGKVLLVIVFPGPILIIEGKANILKERASLNEDPNFRALAVLDNRSGTFLIGQC